MALGQGPVATTTYRAEAEVASELVRLGEVMDLSGLPAAVRERATAVPVARAPGPGGRSTFDAATLNSRARAGMPAIAPWLPAADGKVVVTRRAVSDAVIDKAAARRCLRVAGPLRAGDYPTAADLAPASCETKPRTAFVHDPASGLLRAARDLASGDHVPETPSVALATIRPGDRLRLTAQIGVVRLEREVEAVRPAGADHAVFVKGLTGPVFSAPQSELKP
ncbi:hypothetical protein AS593_07480 [Caulobacter vibrioides]|nr:hypothetical protein AS593_07480 [Caulobacter vibrioides]